MSNNIQLVWFFFLKLNDCKRLTGAGTCHAVPITDAPPFWPHPKTTRWKCQIFFFPRKKSRLIIFTVNNGLSRNTVRGQEKKTKNKMAEYRVIQTLFDIYWGEEGGTKGARKLKTQKVVNDLKIVSWNVVQVIGWQCLSTLKRRILENSWLRIDTRSEQKTGSERVSITLLMLVEKKCIPSCTVPKKNFL